MDIFLESISWCGFQQKSQQMVMGWKGELPTEKKSRHQDNTFSLLVATLLLPYKKQYSLFSQYLNKLIT